VVTLLACRAAHAGIINLDNGRVGDGHLDVGVNEYGAFGAWLTPSQQDYFQPPGATKEYTTYVAGAYIFVTTPDSTTTAVLLNDQKKWFDYVEAMGDGIVGARETTLVRGITSNNASIGTNDIQSAFTITEPSAPAGQRVALSFTLRQTLTAETAPATLLRQSYVITNTGDLDLQLSFSNHWDADLGWTAEVPAYPYYDDVVGASPGLCSVYQHEPGNTAMSVNLSDGGSTVPISNYFGAKTGVTPPNGMPNFSTTAGHAVFDARGIPASWRNLVANVGYNTAGQSGTSPGTDAMLGNEYRFSLSVGQSATIKIDRRWGTIAVACPAPPGCGDNVVNGAEACDSQGVDTATCNSNCTLATCGDGYLNAAAGEECESNGIDAVECNGSACTVPSCGDGYLNVAAGEACDSGGDDTADCNGATCTAPSCGDGYVNTAAGEECEPGTRLCDDPTCTVTFTVGGGCAGCGTGATPDLAGLAGLAMLVVLRRRRRHPSQ
jgi:MYXO-CTERM domain-containing protein